MRASATDTSKVANTSATAASTGSDLNGKAAQDAARKIRARLTPLAARLLGCAENDVVFDGGEVRAGRGDAGVASTVAAISFQELVGKAYLERIQLWSDGFYATPGLNWDRAKLQGHPFFYYAYGAAVAEVVVDTLTGETRVLRADVLHDVGRSLNPALDIGQVEGAFVQGMGWLTTEELVWHPQGRQADDARARAPTRSPRPTTCRAISAWRCSTRRNAEDSIHRSKAVGEPPLLLPFSVLLAIKDAVAASRPTARCDPPLRAPATPEAVLDAIEAVQSSRAGG